MRLSVVVALLVTVCVLMAAAQSGTPAASKNQGRVDAVMKQIAGHESEPADKVFKNVDRLKDVSAGTLLTIMDIGYSRALGVTCAYCHVDNDYSSDAKREKKAAREMQQLHLAINDRLRQMQNLADEPGKRSINCMVCHQGRVNPNRPPG